ncbi:STT3 domain-containing protein [Methanobrevibacter sp. UBA212]|uniref:STT3 domain-containing protein n=1 Tax=Methanobrevibacter sp. UBA212 TaxID=1915476 RepID=UPI0025D04D2D|nr:STT3 domain-containing protein [Methanobrevibacter sp. UBA212]
MNRQTLFTIGKGIIIVLIIMAIVFALKTPAADLNSLDADGKALYTDASGLPYFSEMDSYYNYRLTNDYVDHGFVGDEMVNGSAWDMHRNAPDGNPVSYELGIVQLTSWMHDMANNFLGWHMSVKEVAFWTGAIISTLCVVPAFIFSRRLTNDYGAIVATLIIALAPNYFAHTFPGFFDTDMFYYIFSVFFIFFFVESIRSDNWIWKIVFAILSVISIGLFAQQWSGWIFYVALMGFFAVVYLIVSLIFNVDGDRDQYPNVLQWLVHNKEFLSIVAIGVIAFAGLAVFQGIDGVTGIFSRVFSLLNLQSASVAVGGFPNVLISVAEMQMPSMLGAGMTSMFLASTDGFINGIGGIAVFFAALVVLYILVSRAWKFRKVRQKPVVEKGKAQKGKRVSAAEKLDNSRKFKFSLTDLKFGGDNEVLSSKRLTVLYATLFVVWVIVTALAVSRGSRFITTIVLPFAFLAGIFVGYACDYIKNRLKNDNWITVAVLLCAFLAAVPLATINTIYGIALFAVIAAIGLASIYALKDNSADKKHVPIKKYVLIVAMVIALVTPSVCGAFQTSNGVVPGTQDYMWNALEWIGDTQDNDTVITSWWDYGYLFEVAADRQVTFDGGSQSGDRAFWLGKAMTTDDLELSAGIFRMLDSTGNRAVNKLIEITDSPGKSVDILLDILPRTSSDAQKQLTTKYNLNADQAKEIVGYTHPDNPRPVTFVASSDMIVKAGWWSYFGAWNFDNQTSENYNYVMPYESVKVGPNQNGTLTLQEQGGMTVNAVIEKGSGNNTTNAHVDSVYTETGEPLKINDTEYNPYKISRLIVIEDGYLMKNESIKGADDGNFTMLLMGQNNEYTPILMDKHLENSMFTKLYFYGGANQNIFEPVHSENGVMLFNVNFNNTKAGK